MTGVQTCALPIYITISQNQGVSDLTVNISTMTGLTVSGTLTTGTIDRKSVV